MTRSLWNGESHKSRFFYFFLLMALPFLVFTPILNDFFFRDDFTWIENARITQENFFHIFTLNVSHFFRPLSHIVMMLKYTLFGLNPVGYHVVSLLLHGLNAVVFYVFLRDVLKLESKPLLYGIPLLWETHFIYLEAVAWISAFTNLLLGMSLLGSLIVLARQNRWAFVALFLATLLIKEEGVFLWPLAVVYVKLFQENKWKNVFKRKELQTSGVLWVGYLILQWYLQKSSPLVTEGIFGVGFNGVTSLMDKFMVLLFNLESPVSMMASTVILIILIGIYAAIVFKGLTRPQLLFVGMLLIFSLLPTIFLNFTNNAGRYFYNASFAMAILIGAMAFESMVKLKMGRWIVAPFMLLLVSIHVWTIRSSAIQFEQLGENAHTFIQNIKPTIKSQDSEAEYNFIAAPFSQPEILSMMAVYHKVDAQKIHFDEPENVQFVNLKWE